MSFDNNTLAALLAASLQLGGGGKKDEIPFNKLPEWKQFFDDECRDALIVELKRIMGSDRDEPIVLFLAAARATLSAWTREQWLPLMALIISKNSATLLEKAFEMFKSKLCCLPYLAQIFEHCMRLIAERTEEQQIISMESLKVLHDCYGLVYTNSVWGFFMERKALEHMKYVYTTGHDDEAKTMYLNHVDANAVLKLAWKEGIEYVIYEHGAKPEPCNAAEWFLKLSLQEKNYLEILPWIKELLQRRVFTLKRSDMDAIKPVARRTNVFLAHCVPSDYFDAPPHETIHLQEIEGRFNDDHNNKEP